MNGRSTLSFMGSWFHGRGSYFLSSYFKFKRLLRLEKTTSETEKPRNKRGSAVEGHQLRDSFLYVPQWPFIAKTSFQCLVNWVENLHKERQDMILDEQVGYNQRNKEYTSAYLVSF